MPYIQQKYRPSIDLAVEDLATTINQCKVGTLYSASGFLNYAITKLLIEVYEIPSKQSYAAYNEIIGMLECCKLEFYRKLTAPYEEVKEQENGKVL